MKPEWHPINGFEHYSINVHGHILNTETRKFLKNHDSGRTYRKVYLFDKAHTKHMFYLHRLVAQMFIPNPSNLPEVDHIDMDRLNNSISNLRWVDAKTNARNKINTRGLRGTHIVTNEEVEFDSLAAAMDFLHGANPRATAGNVHQAADGVRRRAYDYVWEWI